MPRLASSLLRRAYSFDPLLPLLLRECRDLDSARNELRWLREHVHSLNTLHTRSNIWQRRQLKSMVRDRARGKPLQYILGDQPFGELEILCRKGVLIPRLETESYTFRTARLILSQLTARSSSTVPFRILDLCTGTGCIPLLLHSLLAPSIPNLTIAGIDISSQALSLAKRNLAHNIAQGHLLPRAKQDVHFLQADVLHETSAIIPPLQRLLSTESHAERSSTQWDVLISNPPYISPLDFGNGTTKRSVRRYEPALALVPPPLTSSYPQPHRSHGSEFDKDARMTAQQDSFYPPLLDIAAHVGARLAVLECGDPAQARRIVRLIARKGRSGSPGSELKAEVWKCDDLGGEDVFASNEDIADSDQKGARAVAIYRV
ncbi:hypothetical protein PRK78_007398 [Emydomyces testavorans]|uniref:Release factor glutamine methyltransferase N-terminal domain-containing protein n=1 Tax=Emydomyces testavorans TaxID=2070801 RepID=A0AAF0ILE0_9EURO|nr:hypothetical protein PRK78_007398 [Emydomyces testavorans]